MAKRKRSSHQVILLQNEDWGLSRKCGSTSVGISAPVESLEITGENERCNVSITLGGTWVYTVNQVLGHSLPTTVTNTGGKLELSFTGNNAPEIN